MIMSRRYWYFYQGTGDESNPYNYRKMIFFGCPVSGQFICAIYCKPNDLDSNIPQASELAGNIQIYITSARLISNYYPVDPQKPFVYVQELF